MNQEFRGIHMNRVKFKVSIQTKKVWTPLKKHENLGLDLRKIWANQRVSLFGPKFALR